MIAYEKRLVVIEDCPKIVCRVILVESHLYIVSRNSKELILEALCPPEQATAVTNEERDHKYSSS